MFNSRNYTLQLNGSAYADIKTSLQCLVCKFASLHEEYRWMEVKLHAFVILVKLVDGSG